MNVILVILVLSVLFQLMSAVMAIRLTWVTNRKMAWLLVAAGITLMTLRRLESLVLISTGGFTKQSELFFEIVGLAISVLMFAGLYLIRPLFNDIMRSSEELSRLNAKLSALSEEQKLLLEHSKDFIYRHDAQGMIAYVSPAVEHITGYSPQEWMAHYTKHYTDNVVNQKARAMTDEMLRNGGEGQPYIIEVRHKNGGNVWLEVNKQPYIRDGKVAGLIGVARDITRRILLENEREKLIDELQDALNNIKTLKGMLPICASCKKIRDDKGYWTQIESYVITHSEAEFTHGICPDCAQKLYPQYLNKNKKGA